MKIDHLGIAVRKLDEAAPRWESTLGVTASPAEVVESQKVKVRFLAVGDSSFELLEPLTPESTIAKFIEGRGEGIHHVAIHVADVAAKLNELAAQGVRLIDKVPRPGARGRLVGFAHPASLGGVLTEFVQGGHP